MPDEVEREHLAAGFGRRLRELRAAAGLTQREVAERARLSPEHVSRLETGHRRPEGRTVRRLVVVLVADVAARPRERQRLNRLASDSLQVWRRKVMGDDARVLAQLARLDARTERYARQIARLQARRKAG